MSSGGDCMSCKKRKPYGLLNQPCPKFPSAEYLNKPWCPQWEDGTEEDMKEFAKILYRESRL